MLPIDFAKKVLKIAGRSVWCPLQTRHGGIGLLMAFAWHWRRGVILSWTVATSSVQPVMWCNNTWTAVAQKIDTYEVIFIRTTEWWAIYSLECFIHVLLILYEWCSSSLNGFCPLNISIFSLLIAFWADHLFPPCICRQLYPSSLLSSATPISNPPLIKCIRIVNFFILKWSRFPDSPDIWVK